MDYCKHLKKPEFRVRRAVIGYEQAATRHLQGYVEFDRSMRLSNVRKVLPQAHWEGAKGDSLSNYNYCIKEGRFDAIGSFDAEKSGCTATQNKVLTPPLIIRGLLCKKTSLQVKLSKAYADKSQYYDRMSQTISALKERHENFHEWKGKFLYRWQHQVLQLVLEQNDREILWICDREGNKGKTFLAHYLFHLYNYQLFDGILSTRDTGILLDKDANGVCFDVTRSAAEQFSYHTLESLKNGHLITGKFHGRTVTFRNMRIVVFANEFPSLTALSRDRWRVEELGAGDFRSLDTLAIVNPAAQFPFVEPPPMPDLSEDFDTRDFVERNAPAVGRDAGNAAAPAAAPAAAASATPPAGPSMAFPRDELLRGASPSQTPRSPTPPPRRAFSCEIHVNPGKICNEIN